MLCRTGVAYSVGQTCSLSFYFKPTLPGIRYGGITLADAAGNLLANSYIYGYGVGPQVLYAPIVQSLVGNSQGGPSGVAINGKGDLFVSNYTGSGLVEIAANGTVSPVGSFVNGRDVAVDGSGNVFVVTFDTLYEVVAVNGTIPAAPVIRTLATGFTVSGGGLAIDGSGNAYVANTPATSTIKNPQGVVYEVLAVGGVIPASSAKLTIGPIFPEPTGVAVDSSGNVYISDGQTPAVFEMLAVNGRVPTSPVILTLGQGSVAPSNIRLDDTNDIFISDSGLPGIIEFPAVNGVVSAGVAPKILGSAFRFPQGLLVDGSGNVFVADRDYTQIVKLNYSSVPTLTFATTPLGQTSTDSPQAVTYTNAGNAPLIFTMPATGTNPTITSDFALSPSSTCPQLTPASGPATLPVGQSCTNQVSFTPTAAGPRTGTLTSVDNNLSVANTTQVVQLNGVGILKPPTIQFSIANHFVDDPPFVAAATSDSPGALTYTVLSGPATIAGSTVTLAGTPGVVTVQVSQAATSLYASATLTASFTVSKHSQTITFLQPQTPVKLGSAPLALQASASSGLPVTFSIVSGSATLNGNFVSFPSAGTVVIAADQPGNAVYNAAPEVTRTVVVSFVTVALTAAPNPVFLHNPVTLTATLSPIGGTPTGSITFLDGGVPLATVQLSGTTASLTLSTLALGTHPVTAVYNGDSNFSPATSPVQNVVVQDFSLTLAAPDITIFHGGTATYALVVNLLGSSNSAGPVTLAVTGTPSMSVVTMTPQTIPAGSGSTPVTLVVATPNYPVGPYNTGLGSLGFALPALALALLVLLRRKKLAGRLKLLATGLVFVGLAVSRALRMLGCGSGWRTQHYTLNITATSGLLQRNINATLTTVCRNGQAACPIE